MSKEIEQNWEQPDMFPETIKQVKKYTSEEMAEIEDSRTVSDAELIKGGGAHHEVDRRRGRRSSSLLKSKLSKSTKQYRIFLPRVF